MALVLKSERQIQSEILSRLISQLGLNDINPGSVLDVLTQAISQQDFNLYYQLAQVSRLVDIDALTGNDLNNKAFEYGLERFLAQKTKGQITIFRPTGFVKVSTSFYAGSPAAISGDTIIDVNDASSLLIGTTGTLILGRGTNNEEEVVYSVAPVDNTTYWRFTLDNPLTKNHAVEETVILKQGNDEIILAGTTVVVPPTGVNAEVQFSVDNDTVLLAGEDRVTNVEVTAVEAGSAGNIPIGAIDGEAAFPSPPFAGARARNDIKFTTGRDLETDDELRDRIKNYVQGISKAVKQAILNAIVGLVDPETAKRVVSAAVILPVDEVGDVKVIIDDGTGFEPSFSSIGFETVLNSATGGEERVQVDRFPVVKAQLESNSEESYNMSSGALTLLYQIGTLQETITFNPSDFRTPDIATAEEVVAAINDKATLIEARTSQVGRYVLITAKRDINESIQVLGGTANAILNFPTDRKDTINLYVDDLLLSKDGETAILDSGNQAPYNLQAVGAFPHELTLYVDGKTANLLTASITSLEVADPTAVTASEICIALNRDIPGIIATPINQNTRVRIESLTKLSDKSKLEVTGGSMNDATNGLDFSTTEKLGVAGDYKFNRELGIIEFTNPLTLNQNVTLGSLFTRAKLRATLPELYSPANAQTLIISIDGGSDQTITFDGTFAGGKTAEETALFINNQLLGGSAIVREIGGLQYLEINSSTYKTSGSIEIKSTSTANTAFGFPEDTVQVSGEPNKAFIVSVGATPFDFAEADSLVVVVDNNIVDNTFSIPMNYPGDLTQVTNASSFRDSTLAPIFGVQNVLTDFYMAFTAGANTVSGTIEEVSDQGGGVARYKYNPVPGTFATFAVAGNLLKVTNLTDSENNGNFLITAAGADYVDVVNPNVEPATGQTGTGVISERRRIATYNENTGALTTTAPFGTTPTIADPFIVIPSTVTNLVNYIRNTKITSFTLKGTVEGVDNNTKLQLSSNSQGSDGYIQVTGGNANRELLFSTIVYRGIQAYSYWTGLLALVHKTIYGDDSDLASFPGVGAAGIIFRILAPTVKQLDVELDVTLQEGISIASLENEVKSAVSAYINTLGVGADVVIERIRAAVIAIPGIIDVVINTPSANISIADNEVARVSDPNILIG